MNIRCDRLYPSAPLRREFHWLPINEEVILKVLFPLTGWNFFSNMSLGADILCLPRIKRAISDYPFCFAGPFLWNSLPSHIRFLPSIGVFKKSLKTCFDFYVSYSVGFLNVMVFF